MSDAGIGPRTGSDPLHGAQEIAVLRAELRGLERVLEVQTKYTEKALDLQATEYQRRLDQLNGERALERERSSRFVSSEVFEPAQREFAVQLRSLSEKLIQLSADLGTVREQGAEQRNSQQWITRLVIASVITTIISVISGIVFAALRGT